MNLNEILEAFASRIQFGQSPCFLETRGRPHWMKKAILFLCLCLTLTGCESFRRKFVRKPKKREVEVVVHEHEYESDYSVAEVYQRYYLFWRSAHDELVNSLNAQDGSPKRRLAYTKRMIDNLEDMRQLLKPAQQKKLDVYILEQKKIAEILGKRTLGRIQRLRIENKLKKQKRQIQKEFAYTNIQEYLRDF